MDESFFKDLSELTKPGYQRNLFKKWFNDGIKFKELKVVEEVVE